MTQTRDLLRLRALCLRMAGALLILAMGMLFLVEPAIAQGTTSYTYDGLGRLTKVMYPDSSIIEYTYDKNNNMLTLKAVGKAQENRAPTATSAQIVTDEDLMGSAAPNVTDPDDGDTHTFTILTQPANGSAAANGGMLEYTPDQDYNGSDSFTFSATDQGGLSVTGTATVTVSPVNDPPIAVDDNITTSMDMSVTFDARTNDSDVDGDFLTLQSITQPANGTAQMILDDHIEYRPNSGYTGADSFEYTIDDGNGASATGTVFITVSDADDPVAMDDNVTTDEDTPVTINVLSNDLDPAGMGLTVTGITDPANGSVADMGSGMLAYTPDENFSGQDSFDYTIEDGNSATSTATVSITVTPVNDPPGDFVRRDPPDQSTQTSPVTFRWTRAVDPDGDSILYTLTVTVDGNVDDKTVSDTMEVVDFAALNLPNGAYTVTWSLSASDGQDSVSPSNGEGSFTLSVVSSIGELAAAGGFVLGQSYPNPVGDGALALVPFSTDRVATIVITLHDALGREVSTLADGEFAPGEHRVEFPASQLAPGTYRYRLTSGSTVLTRSLQIMR